MNAAAKEIPNKKYRRYAGNVILEIAHPRDDRYLVEVSQDGPVVANSSRLLERFFYVESDRAPLALLAKKSLVLDCVAQVVLNYTGVTQTPERKHPACCCTNGYAAFQVDHEVLDAFRYDHAPDTHEICGCDECGAYHDDNEAYAQWVADGKPLC